MKRLLPALAASVVILAACSWTGTGTVQAKEHQATYSYVTMMPCGKTFCPITHFVPECWQVTVSSQDGQHKVCVTHERYDHADIGQPITITDKD